MLKLVDMSLGSAARGREHRPGMKRGALLGTPTGPLAVAPSTIPLSEAPLMRCW